MRRRDDREETKKKTRRREEWKEVRKRQAGAEGSEVKRTRKEG